MTAALFKLLEFLSAKAGETYVTFLNAPIVRQIFEHLINYLGEKLSYFLQEDETLLIIDCQTAEKRSRYQRTFSFLESLPEGATDEQIQDALKKARDASDHAIHWPGVK
jgi:hypothetical protein